LKITHVNFARGFRGGERQTFNLVAGLHELGIEQTIVGRTGSELIRRCAAFDVRRMEIAHPLLGHFRGHACDLLHVHEARGAYWAAIEHALRNTPYLITRRVPNPIGKSLVTSYVYRNASGLCAVSQDVSRRLAGQTGRSVTTILSATSLHPVAADRVRQIRAALGGAPVIGHIGALCDHHKGQSVLIEAFHMLLRDYPDARLLLVGEGPDRARFQHLANGDKRIVFAGFQEQVGPWIAAMDVLAFPSREEGLGSSVLDAMAQGVPIVASAAGGLPELLAGDVRGLTVHDHAPGSWHLALKRMLCDGDMRRRVIQAARQFAWTNGAASMTDQYLEIYARILNGKGESHAIHREESRYAPIVHSAMTGDSGNGVANRSC
jgi:glycosyltransferase involved in cell wall biosynthesis